VGLGAPVLAGGLEVGALCVLVAARFVVAGAAVRAAATVGATVAVGFGVPVVDIEVEADGLAVVAEGEARRAATRSGRSVAGAVVAGGAVTAEVRLESVVGTRVSLIGNGFGISSPSPESESKRIRLAWKPTSPRAQTITAAMSSPRRRTVAVFCRGGSTGAVDTGGHTSSGGWRGTAGRDVASTCGKATSPGGKATTTFREATSAAGEAPFICGEGASADGEATSPAAVHHVTTVQP
jgi:hypothetical protein